MGGAASEFLLRYVGRIAGDLRRLISKPPFVREQKIVGGEIVKDGEHTTVVGGKKLCLLRTDDAPQKDVADEAKRVMVKLWSKAAGKHATNHETRCLWGMSGDMMKLLAEAGLPAELGGELEHRTFI